MVTPMGAASGMVTELAEVHVADVGLRQRDLRAFFWLKYLLTFGFINTAVFQA